MFGDMKQKEMILIYAVIGFGSVALVALGELSSVEPGSPLFKFYLKLVFGGFFVFLVMLFDFGKLFYSRKVDQNKKSRFLRILAGEKLSYVFSIIFTAGVLIFWVFTFANLMDDYDLKFF